MTCAGQAAEILGSRLQAGESLLDAGCGGGYYLWSFMDRGLRPDWHGLDYTPEMVELARTEVASRAGLEPERFMLGFIEDLPETSYDTVLCFNVLTNSPHFAAPLERLLRAARRRVLLRESMGDELVVNFTPDPYLDEGKRHIRVYHNTYPIEEVTGLMEQEGFAVERIRDARTGDGTELVVGFPHQWRILYGERR